jgi:aspartyl-tRNA(Asn)/glutamyl-tRNA(Gln) amidotransferase subunit A
MTPPRGLAEVAALLAAEEASPLEVLEACLARLPDAQAHGAFVVVDEDGARRAAAALPRRPRGPLHGVPVAVKDLIDVAGLPTALGRSRGQVARTDAAIVARLREAGAIVLGKTRTDELGLGALTPGASDPRDASRSPGGSSGGSAIAVAMGAAPLALATDTAGSARIPAAACGVTGLCAAPDWMPQDGVSVLAPSFDRLGLIAAAPSDAALAWTALGGAIGAVPERVVTLADDALGRVEPGRAAAARDAAAQLSARPVELPGPSLPDFGEPRAVVITAEAAARHDAETPAARAQLASGASESDADVRSARACLRELGAALRAAVGPGVLVAPALPAAPPRWDELEDLTAQLRATGRLTRLCGPVNSSGLVAVSVPSGVQVVARRMETALAAALRLET